MNTTFAATPSAGRGRDGRGTARRGAPTGRSERRSGSCRRPAEERARRSPGSSRCRRRRTRRRPGVDRRVDGHGRHRGRSTLIGGGPRPGPPSSPASSSRRRPGRRPRCPDDRCEHGEGHRQTMVVVSVEDGTVQRGRRLDAQAVRLDERRRRRSDQLAGKVAQTVALLGPDEADPADRRRRVRSGRHDRHRRHEVRDVAMSTSMPPQRLVLVAVHGQCDSVSSTRRSPSSPADRRTRHRPAATRPQRGDGDATTGHGGHRRAGSWPTRRPARWRGSAPR